MANMATRSYVACRDGLEQPWKGLTFGGLSQGWVWNERNETRAWNVTTM